MVYIRFTRRAHDAGFKPHLNTFVLPLLALFCALLLPYLLARLPSSHISGSPDAAVSASISFLINDLNSLFYTAHQCVVKGEEGGDRRLYLPSQRAYSCYLPTSCATIGHSNL